MSDEFERYAVYWVPKRADSLGRFGISWTGWCAKNGEPRLRGAFRDITFDIPVITRRIRRHGLHAVIKAPFRLGAGRSRFSLEHFLDQEVEDSVAFPIPRLHLAVVDGSVVLVPQKNSPALRDLIAGIDNAITPLEAATATNGFAEAKVIALRGNADPLVQFPTAPAHRFQIPLTDQLGLEIAYEVLQQLEPLLKPILDEPRRMHDIALMGDPGGGRPLRVLQRYDLHDMPPRKASSAMPCLGPDVLVPMFGGSFTKAKAAI
jgi:hypothetical protein